MLQRLHLRITPILGMNKDLPVGPLQKENRVDGEGADRGVGSQPDEEWKKNRIWQRYLNITN